MARAVPPLLGGAFRSPRRAPSGVPARARPMTDRTSDDAFPVGISITRVFDAPRERVWREWTEPEAFADWFGAADGEVPLDTVEMDVRAGGSFRLTMFAGPSRYEIRWHGVYREVV